VARSVDLHVQVNGFGSGDQVGTEGVAGKTITTGVEHGKDDDSEKAKGKKRRFNIEVFIARHLPDAESPELAPDGGRRWKLSVCPFDPAHADGKASVHESAEGVLGFHCFHRSCAGNGWKELRALFRGEESSSPVSPDGAGPGAEEWPA